MRPRLLVSLLSLRPRSASGVAFVRAAVPEVVRAFAAEGDVLVQCDRHGAALLGSLDADVDVVRTADPRLARSAALRFALPRAARRFQPTVLWVPDVPVVGAPLDVPAVLTVHSHLPLSWPGGASLGQRIYWRLWWTARFREALARAAAVLAPTAAFATELGSLAPGTEGRLHVMHHGVASDFSPGAPGMRVRPAVLCVGNPLSYKNMVGALRIFAGATSGLPHELRIAGVGDAELRALLAASGVTPSVAARVVPLGRLGVAGLVDEYRSASVLLFPSLVESFGLPVVEAMACGTPVACSDLPSLREVAGGAAEHADPGDEEGFRAVLRRILVEPPLAERLRSLGLVRARTFNWQRNGERTAAILRDVATEGTRVRTSRLASERRAT